ncbi:hypothetical protein N0V83_003707 [Neocucurbitaria cava]|uniref:Uncharacterized protein n=1 Tax=Neocucurbitaria cava TaxID=798079 RepID=A0A9W9CPN8_9PLEO|nr:hypothetical protein N0V83_003707 [Neocucurbitaria cava]
MARQLLAQAQKRKIEELEDDKSSMYEIIWYLQTTSPDEATALLQQLRAYRGNDLGAILEQFDRGTHDEETPVSQPNDTPSSVSSSNNTVSTALTIPEIIDHPRFQDRPSNPNSPPTYLVPLSSWGEFATVNGLDGSLEMFFNCVGLLFYIMKREDVQLNIQAIRAAGHAHTPLGDIVNNGSGLGLATMVSELAGMAAIGVVHAQLADPVSAPPSRLADYFYAVAKQGLDFAIRNNPLRAMKVAALVAMYNVALHAQVALAYTGK